MSGKTAVLVFLKFPTPGKVKTRLASTIGDEKAVYYYQKMVDRVQSTLRALDSQSFAVHWMYDTVNSEGDYRTWLKSDATYLPQHSGNLGERLSNAFDLVSKSYSTACAIGTDCIELAPHHFELTRMALTQNDVVLGPSTDGGYYLIGLRGIFPQLFKDISWSTERVADQTRAKIQASALSLHELSPLSDIDTWEDLQKSDLIE